MFQHPIISQELARLHQEELLQQASEIRRARQFAVRKTPKARHAPRWSWRRLLHGRRVVQPA